MGQALREDALDIWQEMQGSNEEVFAEPASEKHSSPTSPGNNNNNQAATGGFTMLKKIQFAFKRTFLKKIH